MPVLPVLRPPQQSSGDRNKNIDLHFQSESALVDGLKSGDRRAFHCAINTFTPRLLALSRRIVGRDGAEDVVQETWMAVCRSIGEFESRSSLSTWLYRIATNKALNMLRQQSRMPLVESEISENKVDTGWFGDDGQWTSPFPDAALPSPEESLSAEDLQDCLDKHIELLPPVQRMVLILKDIEAQSYTEICNVLELSESNVRVLLHRGRMRLMHMIRTYQEDGTC